LSALAINPRYELLEEASGPETPPYRFSKARDREEGRVVSVQIIPAGLLPAAALASFEAAVREAQTLDHPGILRVFEQGVTEDTGELYVVREQLRGITLAERIRRIAPFNLTVATDFALAVAEALASAHRDGVAHGDLRATHVLFSPEGQIKVADFCYGAVVAARTDDPARAAFLLPEGGPVPAPSSGGDLYALGALLYEMLTGVPPLAGGIRVTSPRDVNPSIPPALDGMVQKALHADPSRRYRSAAALVSDLQAVREALRSGKPLDWSPLTDRAPASEKPDKRAPRPPAPPRETEATLVAPVPEGVRTPDEEPSEEWNEPDEDIKGRKKNRMRERKPASPLGVLLGVLVVLTMLAVIGLSWYAVKMFAEVPSDVQVPNLIGKTFDDARRIAAQQHFTLVQSQDSDYSDSMPENQIYAQDPLPGRTIKSGKEVNVHRSLGPRLLVVPPLVGTTQDYAANALSTASLPIGAVTQDYSDTVPSGIVLRQSPEQKSKVARNTAINFAVSKGRQPPAVPASLLGSADGSDKISLTWDAAPRAESYKVLRSEGGDTTTVAQGLANARFSDSGLKPDTAYTYTVTAVNSAGESDASDPVQVTTPPVPVAAPTLPPDTVVTPPDSSVPSGGDTAPSDPSASSRLRQFTINFRVPRRPRRTRHVQIEIQDVTGTNLVYEEDQQPGEQISAPVQGIGNKITFRIFLDNKLERQQTF